MNLVDICKLKYPGQAEIGNITFRMPGEKILFQDWKVEGIPKPSEDDLMNEIALWQPLYNKNEFLKEGEVIIEKVIEETAQSMGYTSSLTCASYVNSANAQWKEEANRFVIWRDALFVYAFGVYAEIENGEAAPTVEQFIEGMPKI